MKPGAQRPIEEQTTAPHAQSARSRLTSHPLILATMAYALGQAANFLFQLRLLDQLGPLQYAEAGLVHLMLVTLIFLADLGYSSLFLREVKDSANWRELWRYALGHKLFATLLALAGCILGWQFWNSTGGGQEYLMWASPACVLALFNYSSPMITQGRRLAGLLLGQIAWPAALIVWLSLPDTLTLSTQAKAGLAFSLGYLVQALASLACSRQLVIWLPLAGRGEIGAALRLSAIGICGTVHDRLTPFLLAPLVPAFLPLLLILNHVLSGLSGIQTQLARLFMPEADTSSGQRRVLGLASSLLWGTALMLQVITFSRGLDLLAEQNQWVQPAALLVLAWGISASSGFFATLLIRLRHENMLLKLLLVGMAGSALLQVTAAWAGSAGGVLWARLLGMIVIAACLLHLLGLRLSAWGYTALALSLSACVIGGTHWAIALGLALSIASLVAMLGRAPCYVLKTQPGLCT